MKVRTGFDILLNEQMDRLKGLRVGLVTHPAAVAPGLGDAVNALRAAGADLRALFGPEHGLYGLAADGAAVEHGLDARSGLPVFSLYGPAREPSAEMLQGIDLLIFDMQDVGVRFYTYLSTLFYTLRGAAKAGKRVLVLDRPNPIGGELVEGPAVEAGFESFVGIIPVPLRHALTLGELARWINLRLDPPADLQVVGMQGWTRDMCFDQTGLTWIPTSPAMPHLSTALVYPGTCLVEGTNLSEGRGTALPFELVGAPWVDGWRLAERLNTLDLPGVFFRPAGFIPSSSKHSSQRCGGVQLHITDRAAFRPLRSGLHLLVACRELFGADFAFLPTSWEGHPAHFDLLMGSDTARRALEQGAVADDLLRSWKDDTDTWLDACQPVLLY